MAGQVTTLQAPPDEASPLPGRLWRSLTLCSINRKHLDTSGGSHSISSLSGVFPSICSSRRAPRILHNSNDLCIEAVSSRPELLQGGSSQVSLHCSPLQCRL